MLPDEHGENLGETLAPGSETRIQLCGRLVAKLEGRRIEELLPGRQGRLLFAYLAANRRHAVTRSQLTDVLWPNNPPSAADAALSALLTKLRGVVGTHAVVGKQELRLVLPADAWIDLEAALEGLHRAESAASRQDWTAAWGPARVALHIAMRPFLPGYDAAWVDATREQIEDVLMRAHECVANTGLALRGSELTSAARSARALMKLAPYRESGYRFMMEILALQGNVAEALLIYERLRRLLSDDLGASPSPATLAVHRRLLQGDAGRRGAVARELKTVLFTDIVGSTELAAAIGDHAWQDLLLKHQDIVRRQLERAGGHEVDTAGDGFLATFESPVQAVACACKVMQQVGALGVSLRVGIHTGECEVLDGKVCGIAVHLGARIAAHAQADEVLVSSTVKDLMTGSDIEFDDRGLHTLRGVPGEWRLFAVQVGSAPKAPTREATKK
ncbi:hypothetical protein C7T35_32880 [Variovorax sp. WS11]|uniref:BTAD domain-containing putative transcriptional regulator n=1 Tax=Variovorax sp. WS11 TaxID=1105204 RepID=UPI000D0D4409|nr:BTAD domain-containing putative transcriptional regulator [Variovorax sp. WS11]PSL80359.1 hypothetical protein C7T35_32880 [Variovorax sp. WS11]